MGISRVHTYITHTYLSVMNESIIVPSTHPNSTTSVLYAFRVGAGKVN